MGKTAGKEIRLLKGEKFMYVILVLMIIAIPIASVASSSLLSETNNEVEKIKRNIEKQTVTNQSLTMQIDELASLENIQTVAEEYGLSYNNSNIKSIGK